MRIQILILGFTGSIERFRFEGQDDYQNDILI